MALCKTSAVLFLINIIQFENRLLERNVYRFLKNPGVFGKHWRRLGENDPMPLRAVLRDRGEVSEG